MAAKKKEKKEPVFDVELQRDQFHNTNDWPLYRPKALFRVKQLGDDENAVIDRGGSVQLLNHKELSEVYEPIKGLHARPEEPVRDPNALPDYQCVLLEDGWHLTQEQAAPPPVHAGGAWTMCGPWAEFRRGYERQRPSCPKCAETVKRHEARQKPRE